MKFKSTNFLFPLLAAALMVNGGFIAPAKACYLNQVYTIGSAETATDNNSFALDAYRVLGADGQNLLISPYGLREAFLLTREAAEGECRDEINEAFHMGSASYPHGLWSGFEGGPSSMLYAKPVDTFRNANALMIEDSFKPSEEFLKTAQSSFGTKLMEFDSSSIAGLNKATREINDWCSKQTSGLVDELIPEGMLDADSVMLLANAVHFKDEWRIRFDKNNTADRPFQLASGEEVTVPTMMRNSKMMVGEFSEFQILSLPYRHNDLEMTIFLPREESNLAALESRLSASGIELWTSDMVEKQVQLYLPRWEMSGEYDLIPALRTLGMSAAFNPGGFTRALGRNVFIGDVLHSTRIEVDEKGTEAAAGTAVHFQKRALNPDEKIIRVDRPFSYMIRNSKSGLILFIGRVADPR